ncbi:cytochrome b/b6 domain-containing protein [Pseudidiomarina homiensis]|uniref:cytochrome b/b6 domain-containing protein n=1 Tax=Pseudidiomarina homiensis TaxID=364198 RepID=UPI00215AF83E|nr:cytochrome b/b6 domain-containing protein [Pseudidiomarina homiensis]
MKIWDSFVRGYHWLLVVAIAGLWWTAEQGYMDWHMRIALAVGALLLARVVWALIGSENARFTAFVHRPQKVVEHLRDLQRKNYQPSATHNPAGGWAVLLMWALLFVQVTTGLFATDEIFFSGPLASLVSSSTQGQLTDLHEINFNVLLTVIALHVVAILLYRMKGVNLLSAMVHGKRQNVRPPRLVNGLFGWTLAAVIAASAYYFLW